MCYALENIPDDLFRNCKNVKEPNIYINSTDIPIDTEWFSVLVSADNYKVVILNRDVCECDYVIDWGDGNIEHNSATHTYEFNGNYIIRIKGSIVAKNKTIVKNYGLFKNAPIKKAIVYGSKFHTDLGLFRGCKEFEEIDPNFFSYSPNITSISYMFRDCKKFTTIPDGLFDNL